MRHHRELSDVIVLLQRILSVAIVLLQRILPCQRTPLGAIWCLVLVHVSSQDKILVMPER